MCISIEISKKEIYMDRRTCMNVCIDAENPIDKFIEISVIDMLQMDKACVCSFLIKPTRCY